MKFGKFSIVMRLLVLFLSSFSLSSAVTFNCIFTDEQFYYGIHPYACSATVSEYGDSTTLLDVQGNHLDVRTNRDVQALIVSNQLQVTQIPKDLEKFFPDLLVIKWTNGGLTSLTVDNLWPFPNLAILDLADNNLSFLDGNLFIYARYLRVINFNRNQIRTVGFNFLQHSSILDAAYFFSNPCINQFANSIETIRVLQIALWEQCECMCWFD